MELETITIDTSAASVYAMRAKTALAEASDLVIDSQTMYELAASDLRDVKSLQRDTEASRVEISGPLNIALKAHNARYAAPKEWLANAEEIIKRGMLTWTREQERIAAEARRVAEEATRKEQARLAAIEREAQEAARKAQEKAQAAAKAGDKAAAEAALAVARAAQQEAATAATTASVVTVPSTVAEPTKVSGISGRVTYKAEVDDLMALVKAVAAGEAPIDCLQANDKFLGGAARLYKKSGAMFPGVNCVAERGIAARAA